MEEITKTSKLDWGCAVVALGDDRFWVVGYRFRTLSVLNEAGVYTTFGMRNWETWRGQVGAPAAVVTNQMGCTGVWWAWIYFFIGIRPFYWMKGRTGLDG